MIYKKFLILPAYLDAAVPIQGDVSLTVLAVLSGVVGQVAGSKGEPALLPVSSQLPFFP